jgi:hypothetical protein
VLFGRILFSFQAPFGHPSPEAGKSMMTPILAVRILNPGSFSFQFN